MSNPARVGDVITYNFSAKNTGSAQVTGVVISDTLPGLTPLLYTWPDLAKPGVLGVGQTATATATYTLTQADLDAGHVVNHALVSGKSPGDGPNPEMPAEVDTRVPVEGSLEFAKSADASGVHNPAQVGDEITYNFSAKNTGTAQVTSVVISDTLPGLSALTYIWPDAARPGVLGVGQTVTATATYALTQADLNAGHVSNHALVAGSVPGDGSDPKTPDDTDTPLPGRAGFDFTKTADTSGVGQPARVGDNITYHFAATNTGSSEVTNVTISDPLVGLSPLTYIWPDAARPGVLEVGQSVTATATYTLVQADLDAGHVANAAIVSGQAPGEGPTHEVTTGVDTPVPVQGGLELTKSADASAVRDPAQVGDKIIYHFSATNTGTAQVTGVVISDPLPGLTPLIYSWPARPGVLGVDQTVTATATYTLTQADLDLGHVANHAFVTGNVPGDSPDPEAPGEADTPLPGRGGFEFRKTADASGVHNPARVGDVITYRFAATNTGTAQVTNVAISDPLPGLSNLTYVWPGTPGVLGVGQTVTATATYALTQADLDAGHVANLAHVTGDVPGDGPDPTMPGNEDTPLPVEGRFEFTKTADASAVRTPARVGDEITYHFTATNMGTAAVTGVVVKDPLLGLSTVAYIWPDAARPGVLCVGQTVTATASYVLTQADLDAGHVANQALVTGQLPGDGPDPAASGDADTPLPGQGGFEFTKTADASGVGHPAQVGDTITYHFTATNTGTAQVNDVVVSDTLPGLSPLTYTWPDAAKPGVLGVGQTVTATATYLLTQADLDLGHVANHALVTGDVPGDGPNPEVPGDADTPLPGQGSFDFSKTADNSAVHDPARVGDIITYRFEVRNTGTARVTGVVITDQLPGLSPLTYIWPDPAQPGVLGVGQTATATATYELTAADLKAGHVVNQATVAGTMPDGDMVAGDDGVDTTLPGEPSPEDPLPIEPSPEDPVPTTAPSQDPVPTTPPSQDPVPPTPPSQDPVPTAPSSQDPLPVTGAQASPFHLAAAALALLLGGVLFGIGVWRKRQTTVKAAARRL
jgi:uncharacterized repeat protein (TIGR01451 family)